MTIKDFKQVGNMGEVVVSYLGKKQRYYDLVHELGATKVWGLKIAGIEAQAKTQIRKNTNELNVIPYTLLYLED